MEIMIADVLTTVIQLVMAGIIMARFIETRRTVLFTVLMTVMEGFVYWYFSYVMPGAATLKSGLTVLVQLLLILLFRRIPVLPSVLYMAVYMIAIMVTEIPIDLMVLYFNPSFRRITDLSLSWLLATRIAYLPFYAISLLIPYYLCKRLIQKQAMRGSGRYLPFLAVQAFMVMLPVWMGLDALGTNPMLPLLCMFYLVVNLLLDFLLIWTFRRMDQAYALEQQSRESRQILQAQSDYYRQMRDNAHALSQIRSEMRIQLQVLQTELDQGDYALVQSQLAEFRENVNRTGRKHYTGSNVVDAVIEAKVGICHRQAISLHLEGSIPADIGVEPIHLCSVVGNLLDNAIHAVEQLPPDIPKDIWFHASYKGGRLIFICENTAKPGTAVPRKKPGLDMEHGWGLNILERIAQDYSGQMEIENPEGRVRILLWMIPKEHLQEGAEHTA